MSIARPLRGFTRQFRAIGTLWTEGQLLVLTDDIRARCINAMFVAPRLVEPDFLLGGPPVAYSLAEAFESEGVE